MTDKIIKYYHIEEVAPFIIYLISLSVAVVINKTMERMKQNEHNLF